MNKKTRRILLFSIIILVIAIIFFIKSKSSKPKVQEYIVSPVNSLEITDTDIQRSKDSAKVIIYWNIDNEESLNSLKLFNDLYEKYTSIYFLAVNTIDNPTKASVYLNNNNISIPNNTTSQLKLKEINEKQLEKIPCYAFILKDGSLLDFTSKELDKDSIEAYLDILAENY